VLIEWVKEEKAIIHTVRIGTQAHKIWYPAMKRGV